MPQSSESSTPSGRVRHVRDVLRRRFALYWRFARLLRPYRWGILIHLQCTALIGVLTLVNPLLAKVTFDRAFPQRDFRLFFSIVAAGLVVSLAAIGLDFMRGWIMSGVEQRFNHETKRRYYRNLHAKPLAVIQGIRAGDHLYRMSNDLDNVRILVLETLPVFILATLRFLLLLALTLYLNWKLVVFAVASFPLFLVATVFFTEPLRRLQLLSQRAGAELVSGAQEGLAGIREIKGFGRSLAETRRFVRDLTAVVRLNLKTYRLRLIAGQTTQTIGVLWSLGMSCYSGYLVLTGELSIGEIVAIGMYLSQLVEPLQTYQGLYRQVMTGLVSADRVVAVLDAPSESALLPVVSAGEEPGGRAGRDPGILRGAVEFHDVSFAYVPGRPVLRGLNFRVEPGSRVALVGPNGAGKTTLTHLISRFYDPSAGCVAIDGIDLRTYNLQRYRSQIGMVLQKPFLFRGSVEDNILFGAPGPEIGGDDVVRVARQVGVHELIERFPQGYKTWIGEGGVGLSEGQQQLVAIVRAFLRDPRILLLDEATSMLDVSTEMLVRHCLDRLLAGRTAVVIAHKLETIRDADRIFVLNRGALIESGTHDELTAADGLYARMSRAQFQDWAEIEPGGDTGGAAEQRAAVPPGLLERLKKSL